MATITLHRAPQWINRFQSYRIVVNGRAAATLGYGETKTLNLEAGTYTVRATIDWMGSETHTITLQPTDTVTLGVGCTVHLTILQTLLSLTGLAVLFANLFILGYIAPVTWAVLLVLWVLRDVVLTRGKSFLYYLTRGRSTYLYIKPLPPAVPQ